MCDIVIPVYDQIDYTKACLESIFAHTRCAFRLIIVDNGSKELETGLYLNALLAREPERVKVLRIDNNQGYVKAANLGLENTTAEYVVIMNNDTLVYPGWLSEMIAIAQQDASIGIVNPQWDPSLCKFKGGRDKYFQQCVVPQKGVYIETDWARGFCYLTKRCVIDKIGGLDLVFSPGYFDDWDYSMRAMAAGYRCVVALGSFVFHFKNVTYSVCGEKGLISTLLNEKAPIFYKRWGRSLKLLIVNNGVFDDIEISIRDILRDQNRVVLISSHPVDMRHTNLIVIRVKRWLIGVMVVFVLVDNVRHSVAKRFNLVLVREGMSLFFRKVLRYLFNYRVEYFKDNFMLCQMIKSLKF